MKTIKVTQTASEKFSPDTAVFELRLTAESKKHSEAVAQLRDKTETVTTALTNAKLVRGEISSSGASVSSIRRDGKLIYCAHESVKIVLPVSDARLGDVSDALEKSGAEWSQSYILSDKSHKLSLVKKAVDAAREVAAAIASASDVKLGALVGVEYASQYGGGGVRMLRAASFSDITEPEQISAEETVTCEWEIA